MEAAALQNSIMEMPMSICRKESEDEKTKTKRKSDKVDRFSILPDDILSNIFKRLPDTFLCYNAKFVCRGWLDVIRYRILTHHASLILQKSGSLTARHVCIREERQGLEVRVQQDLDIPSKGIIRSWDKDFLLISDYKENKQSLYVYNLITKEGSYLPKCNASCGGHCSTPKCGVALSFDWFIYKVVHLFMGPPIECHILTLGLDIASSKWKKIEAPNRMDGGHLYSFNPVSIQGRYIHWEVDCGKRLVSMDVVNEKIVDMSLPLPGTIFVMGSSLALFAGDASDKAEIWILKDFQMKKWEKLQSVNIEKWYYRRHPVCGVIMSNRYIILECKEYKGMCYYDLRSGVVKKLDIDIDDDDVYIVHSSPPRKIYCNRMKLEG